MTKWWTKEYTWSGQKLELIKIEAKVSGKCYEIGSHNFRYDWGRVIEIENPYKIIYTWQVNPIRVPEPDPKKS